MASTFVLFFAFLLFCWWKRLRTSCRTGTTNQISLETVKQENEDQRSSPCIRAYEEIEPSYSEMHDNEIYHDLDDQIQDTSLDVMTCPSASSLGNIYPEYDRAIPGMPRDTNEGYGRDDQSVFYHVIDIPDSGEQYIKYSTEKLYVN